MTKTDIRLDTILNAITSRYTCGVTTSNIESVQNEYSECVNKILSDNPQAVIFPDIVYETDNTIGINLIIKDVNLDTIPMDILKDCVKEQMKKE